MNPRNQKKVLQATFIEVCFLLGITMTILWGVILAMWKLNALDLENTYIRSLILWSFKMGFSGAVYMVIAPVVRYGLDVAVRSYHYVGIFFGLGILTFTGSNLTRNSLLGSDIFWTLSIPLIMTSFMMMKKSQNGGFPPVPRK